MLTQSELCYCEKKCYAIIQKSLSRKQAKKRIMNFSYKGVRLNSKQTDNFIDSYISVYGMRYTFKGNKRFK